MLESLFNSKSKERILIFLSAREEGYAREIAKYFGTALSPIQLQLDKLEAGNILASKSVGKTRVYLFNKRYPFYKEISDVLKKMILFLPKSEKEKLLMVRKRPRRKEKPL